MNLFDCLLAGVIVCAVIGAILSIRRHRKKGGCCGDCGNCKGCH